jgi:hypothetical protein
LTKEKVEVEKARKEGTAVDIAKRETRSRVMEIWQWEWNEATTGRWMHRLISDVRMWENRKWGQVNYHVTQILKRHG